MLQFLQQIYHRPDFWTLAAIPLLAALIGLLTNWIAVMMIFGPQEYTRFLPGLGWQGIVPAKSAKLAGILVDNTLARLGSLRELFEGMEPERITEHITNTVSGSIEDYVDEIMTERSSVLWENLPVMIKSRVYARARRQMPEVLDNVVEDIAENIEELVDLKPMVVKRMREDRTLLVRLFRECGQAELNTVIWLGLVFGLLIGLAGAGVYTYFPERWVFLLFGFLAGYCTNWLALSLIFKPVEPVSFGPFTLQGLFLRRRQAVAEKFAEICVTEVINLRTVMIEVLSGPRADRTKAIIKRHMRPLLESGVVRTAVQLTLGAEGYATLKHHVAERAVAMSMEPLVDLRMSQDRSSALSYLFRHRMAAMSNADFEKVLKPIFQEDEWALNFTGGVVGLAAGWGLWWVLAAHRFF